MAAWFLMRLSERAHFFSCCRICRWNVYYACILSCIPYTNTIITISQNYNIFFSFVRDYWKKRKEEQTNILIFFVFSPPNSHLTPHTCSQTNTSTLLHLTYLATLSRFEQLEIHSHNNSWVEWGFVVFFSSPDFAMRFLIPSSPVTLSSWSSVRFTFK